MPLLDDPTLPIPTWRNVKGAMRGLMGMATPPDPYVEAGRMVQQARQGDYLGALETGFGAMPNTGAIKAYHGSPHSFDRFSLDKIGTGEGAQAYGHGLYFAEKEGVARSYRDALAKADGSVVHPDEKALSAIQAQWDDLVAKRRAIWDKTGGRSTPDADAIGDQLDALHAQAVQDTIDRNPHLTKGSMYEVNINADPEHFLDWDKPLSEHPESIRRKLGWTPELEQQYLSAQRADDDALLAALEGSGNYSATKLPIPQGLPPLSATGEDIVRGGSVFDRASDVAKAQKLREAGIPGIKYLDQGSRGAGEGSRNYVVFDDKLVDIARKYGLLPLGLGGFDFSQQEQK